MSAVDAESPESGTIDRSTLESAALSEIDLALAEALQVSPRAPWTRIAAAVGIDATTAARRWHRLTSAGLAWLTAYPTTPTLAVGYVDLACRPDALGRLAEQLCGWRCVFSLERTTGPYQLSLGVDARSLASLDSLLSNALGGLAGLRSVRLSLVTRIYREGRDWLVHALTPRQRAVLDDCGAPARPAGPARWQDADRALIGALGTDARRGCAELARVCGISESAVRRRLSRLLRSRGVGFRCDIAHGLAGWPVIAGYRINVPGHRLDQAGRALSLLPETRLCAAATGEHNLVLSAWLHAPSECSDFEARLPAHVPELHVAERSVALHMPKRMGRLLDPEGRAVGHLPMVAAA